MKEYQFSRLYDFGKLFNMSVKVYIFIPWGEWEFYNIGQNPSSSIFMKIHIYTSVVSVFIQVQNLFSSENGWKSLNFTRPRVVLTRNHKFKMSVILLESKLYLWKFVFLHSFGRGIRIYFHLSTKINR